jgi:hypothetical protein
MDDPFAKWRTQPVTEAPAPSGDPFAKWRDTSAPKQSADPMAAMPEWMQTVHNAIGPSWGDAITLGMAGIGGRIPRGGMKPQSVMPGEGPPPSPGIKTVPTRAEIKDMSREIYKEAEEAGVRITPEAYNRLAYGIRHMAKKEGFASDVHPKAWHAAERIYSDRVVPPKVDPMSRVTGVTPKEQRRTYSFEDIDMHRRRATDALRGRDERYADDRRLAGKVAERIDEWWNSLEAKDIAGGDIAKAQALVPKARALWGRQAKARILDNIKENALDTVGANYTSAGLQTALRQQFKALNKKIRESDGKYGNFSKEEKALINSLTRGVSLENHLRYFGKLAPTSPMSAIMSMFLGHTAGGPVGAAATLAGGAAAAKASAGMQAKKLDQLNALVRRGYADDASY